MDIFSSAKLEKVVIKAYKEKTRDSNECETYTCMFNPESYSQSAQSNFDGRTSVGSPADEAQYINSSPETLRFKIIIDGTGVDDEYSHANAFALTKDDSIVSKNIKSFREEIMAYDGEIHQPRFLVVSWGDLNFPCLLNSAQFNYTHFSNSGRPLRAEIDVDFFYDSPREVLEAKAVKSSPDLTHIRVIKAHDRLPLMCEKIYGAPGYYLWVAQVNQLDDFRNLIPGQEIYFPPLDK